MSRGDTCQIASPNQAPPITVSFVLIKKKGKMHFFLIFLFERIQKSATGGAPTHHDANTKFANRGRLHGTAESLWCEWAQARKHIPSLSACQMPHCTSPSSVVCIEVSVQICFTETACVIYGIVMAQLWRSYGIGMITGSEMHAR